MTDRRTSPRSGIALVLVLGMLVLMSVLLLAFFATVSTERTASQTASDGASARQYAETTVNLVMAQLRDATNNAGADRAWASQPGAVRSYGTPTGTGDDRAQNTVYKLYSAEVMREKESDYDPQNDTSTVTAGKVPTLAKADFTDLNMPLFVQEGTMGNGTPVWQPHFPIIDPRAKYSVSGAATSDPAQRLVEGFDCADYTMLDPDGTAVPVLPLPVKWLYILRDGSIGPASKATKANPMVARTAFWTDDESAKLNINTASEGTFWDTPYVSSIFESGWVDTSGNVEAGNRLNLAVAQPTKREYQRYPGHPATTSLSPVLRRMFPPASGAAAALDVDFKNRLYQILPHLTGGTGSSQAGSLNPSAPISGKNQSAVAPLVDDRERLFVSVDELALQPSRWNTGAKKPIDNSELTPALLDRVGFFLTAQSRAPELNLFGRPRVAIWPVPRDVGDRTAYDKLFAFTSSYAGEQGKPESAKGYYFIRDNNPASPGYKSMTRDYDLPNSYGKSRNREVYAYLQKWMRTPVPGYGGTFFGKYGADSDQILTEIYDYIRCTNLLDGTAGAKQYSVPYRSSDTDTDEDGAKPRPNEWSGQVAPIRIGTTQGFGRFATLTEAAVLFYAPSTSLGAATDAATTMRAVLLFEFATPMPGYTGLRDTFSFRVKCDETMNAAGQPIFSAGQLGYNIVDVDALHSDNGRAHAANRGFSLGMFTFPGTNAATSQKGFFPGGNPSPSTADKTKYPYVSAPINIGAATKTFDMSGGTFTMEIFAGNDPTGADPLVQTITFAFPSVSGLPKAKMWAVLQKDQKSPDEPGDEFKGKDYNTRVRDGVLDEDTVRSVEINGPTKGDYRLSAARTTVPKEYFQGRSLATKYHTAERHVHGLKEGHADPARGATPFGNFAKGAAFRGNKPPDVPGEIDGVTRADGGWGDWDRGISKQADGPFCNMPDEGNLFFDMGPTNLTRLPYYRGPSIRQVNDTYYTPNRLVASPVTFGSLPTGVMAQKPWQTLLFRPDRRYNEPADHPGIGTRGSKPADYLLLDLFQMPIVEPYAISEPGSTTGKVNLNFAIAPFGYMKVGSAPYVRRDTALRGVLKPVKMMAIAAGMTDGGHAESLPDVTCRYDIDPDATLGDLQKRFDDPLQGLFRSAGEVCDVDLYPRKLNGSTDPRGYAGTVPAKKADFGQFWWDNRLTGDSGRERPYAMIYPRVTTKSNVFTVHLRVQVIAKNPSSAANAFDETKDRVASEYRGSSMIERFLDPNDPALKNWDELTESLEPYYRLRVVSTKRFLP